MEYRESTSKDKVRVLCFFAYGLILYYFLKYFDASIIFGNDVLTIQQIKILTAIKISISSVSFLFYAWLGYYYGLLTIKQKQWPPYQFPLIRKSKIYPINNTNAVIFFMLLHILSNLILAITPCYYYLQIP